MEASVKHLIEADVSRLRPWIAVVAVVVALLLQAYLPLLPFFSRYASMADLPLLITIYLALLRRSPVAGLLIGLVVGLAQDSLSAGPIGIYGILKTVIGYICPTLTQAIAVDSLAARVVLVWCLYLLHQAMLWVMQHVLLEQPAAFAWQRMLMLAALNAGLALVIYRFLDRFREST